MATSAAAASCLHVDAVYACSTYISMYIYVHIYTKGWENWRIAKAGESGTKHVI